MCLVSEGAVLVKELKPDTEYAFYLNGYNDVGQGAQAKLLDKTLISPPLGLIVQADPDYPDIVQLNWAFNANITKYRYVHWTFYDNISPLLENLTLAVEYTA